MTNEELNKQVCRIMGLPWEDWRYFEFTVSWVGFGLMWEFMQKHKRWEEFIYRNGRSDFPCISVELISPRPFAEAMCEFFEGQ